MLRTFVDQAAKPAMQVQMSQLRADRDALLQYLMQANLKLQEYDQERTNFLGRALHDFRAPLTALTGYCGLLENEQLGPITEDQREVLVRMQNSAKRLSRLTSGMFQLSIGQHVEQKPRLLHGEISECVLQALHEVGPFIEERHLDVSVSVSPSPEGLLFDPLQLEQVVLNLLDNACKFTPKFGKIEVRGKPYFWDRRMSTTGPIPIDRRELRHHVPNSFRIDVLDSGPPIPDDHLTRIFEEYTRYSGGQDRSGGGLGLAICSMTVRLHNGCVWAENSASGPMFSFVLPFPENSVGSDRSSPKTSAAAASGPSAVNKR
jgi:signal transduction histidine kinase